MSDFRQLEAPVYKEYFDQGVLGLRGWINIVKGESSFYTLHTNGELHWYHESNETVMFDSELHAIDGAFNYYVAHSEFYPYHDIWQKAVARSNGLAPEAAVAAAGSHKMEFI